MAKPCTVCGHPAHTEIDQLLAAGTPHVEVARRFQLHERSVNRHAANHLPLTIREAAAKDAAARDIDVLTEMKELHAKTKAILDTASKDKRLSLAAIREARLNLELIAKLLGQIETAPTVNVTVNSLWIEFRGVIMTALVPYPEARAALAAALLNAGVERDS
ncbi:MAG: hypothetical protein BroJett018_55030 [Chloroflexota bacterium]|nr:MAG: hypothetical protein BroJett018_55030 [Chloroflexota bacterium]